MEFLLPSLEKKRMNSNVVTYCNGTVAISVNNILLGVRIREMEF
jgi:hypothetical protein